MQTLHKCTHLGGEGKKSLENKPSTLQKEQRLKYKIQFLYFFIFSPEKKKKKTQTI